MARKDRTLLVVVREEERGFAAAAHLLGAIPAWGLVFLACLWVYFKERSREVIFHIQQAMMFQTVFLAAVMFWVLMELLLLPIRVVHAGVAGLLEKANLFFLVSCYVAYAVVCAIGCVRTMSGRPFLYPAVGRRILEGSLTNTRTEG
ncbi:MAG: DUF4870 domain-containing protein [Candidatus Sumerlaeia bacterium]|nr:DUF4870 domain-containing protein [Candidatus Sumerlaeia bacterium]